MSAKFFSISWDEMHRESRTLASCLLNLGKWEGIIAVTRGGMVPAMIVARELDIRRIETVAVISYAGDDMKSQQTSDVQIIGLPRNVGDGTGWLVIDDLVDTGRTFEVLRPNLPKAHFATVYGKPKGVAHVDTFVSEFSQDTWLYFPWDIVPQFIKPLASQQE